MGKRPKLSAASGLSFDHGPRAKQTAEDAAALARGEPVLVICSFRRMYGERPERWRAYYLELAPDGPALRRALPLSLVGRRIVTLPDVLSTRVRPFKSVGEAMRFAGSYAPGGPENWAGGSIISCTTSLGVMEIAVARRYLQLVLQYFDTLRWRRERQPPAGDM